MPAVCLVLLLQGCGPSAEAPDEPVAATTSASAPSYATYTPPAPSATPTAAVPGVPLTLPFDSKVFNGPTFTMRVDQPVGAARTEGGSTLVGVPMTFSPVSGAGKSPYIPLRLEGLSTGYVGPASLPVYTGKSASSAAKACAGIPIINAQLPSTDLAPGLPPLSGCVIFDVPRSETATHIGYREHLQRENLARWEIKMPEIQAADPPAPPAVLAEWSGYGSELLTVDAATRQAGSVKVCWQMTGQGNNILQSEGDTAGADLKILTNVIGPVSACTITSLSGYIQVIASADWSIQVSTS